MKTYKVTSIFAFSSPQGVHSLLFPSVDLVEVEASHNSILVTVPDSAPAPADLGPLVRVELVPPSPQG